ncbi:MAG: iron-sulfur cluster assembly scaffold protein [Candidatus Micrarchaeota archaeon]
MEDIYQEFIIELYKNPLNFGKLEGATHHAEIHNTTCGDMIEIYLKVKDGVVAGAKFTGKGCAISQASSSLFTGFLKGKRLEELGKMTKEDVLKLIKIDLSKNPTRMKCALLPLDALRKALRQEHP